MTTRFCTLCNCQLTGLTETCTDCSRMLAEPRSPPGLILTAPKADAAAEETTEENVWGKIETWLRTRQGPWPVVTCGICQTELVIPGLQEEDGDREASRLLPCGHVLGEDCVERWIDVRLRGALGTPDLPTCPLCRKPIFDDSAERDEFDGEDSEEDTVSANAENWLETLQSLPWFLELDHVDELEQPGDNQPLGSPTIFPSHQFEDSRAQGYVSQQVTYAPPIRLIYTRRQEPLYSLYYTATRHQGPR